MMHIKALKVVKCFCELNALSLAMFGMQLFKKTLNWFVGEVNRLHYRLIMPHSLSSFSLSSKILIN